MRLARIHISTAPLCTFLLALVGLASVQPATAQTVGDCETGNAEAYLDVGDIRAKILNTGGLFWNGGQNVYEAPKGSGLHSIFSMTFLIGGLVDGDLHMAASRYGPYEFWPGPIPEDGSAPTDCDRFDRIYEVQRTGGEYPGPVHGLSGDIDEWPVELGAPFVDVNGVPGYQPGEGDHPEIVGDQMLWWVMNDCGNEHEESDREPLGIEVRASVFAFDAVGALGRATFYRYQIRNRSDRPVRSTYTGLFQEVDLGTAFDDYIGSDTTSGTAYFYNADDHDDGEYGDAPPAIGFTVLKRPHSTIDTGSKECSYADRQTAGLTSHIYQSGGGGVIGAPGTGSDYYNYLRARWLDGLPMALGGGGFEERGRSERIAFVFPGNPVTGAFWSELNSDGRGTPIDPADRKSISGVGPFCLGPGDETEVVFAIVWERGESNLDSVSRMRTVAAGLQSIADTLLAPRRLEEPEPEAPAPASLGASIYPNPATNHATLRLGLPRAMDVRVDVFDALGRRVEGVVNAQMDAADRTWTLKTANWPPGVYLVRMQLDHITETRRLVVVR